MVIPYRTAKFKSANIFAMAILGPTTKFNSRQYFWLYGRYVLNITIALACVTYIHYKHAQHGR